MELCRLRKCEDNDDVTSFVKSTIPKRTKTARKRRRGTSWASGVIRKPIKRKKKDENEAENESENEAGTASELDDTRVSDKEEEQSDAEIDQIENEKKLIKENDIMVCWL